MFNFQWSFRDSYAQQVILKIENKDNIGRQQEIQQNKDKAAIIEKSVLKLCIV